MSTLLRLSLSQRQADALEKWLPFAANGLAVTDPDQVAALREVAEKLKALREG